MATVSVNANACLLNGWDNGMALNEGVCDISCFTKDVWDYKQNDEQFIIHLIDKLLHVSVILFDIYH